jgi:hypothetical protein
MKTIIIFIMIFVSFLYGILVGRYQYPPFHLIKNLKNFIISEAVSISEISPSELSLTKFKRCNIPKTSVINNNSTVFVGHAYGSHSSTAESFLSPHVEKFIKMNSSKLNLLVFTGDVFSVPSLEKWKKLRNIADRKLDILIAPGNHDVGRPDSNDLFKISEFGKQTYPIITNLNNVPLILENSVQSEWLVSQSTMDLVNSIEEDISTVLIARHHTPIRELVSLTNVVSFGSKYLDSVDKLSQKFNQNQKYYWIIGDSGADHLPRLSCLKFKNHIFLINGLGELEGDSILIYHNKEFYEYTLKPIEN